MKSNSHTTVPYGYEPVIEKSKGTLIYYDSFEHTTDNDLNLALQTMDHMQFTRLVLYPLHELTVKRMSKEPVSAYYKREDRLHAWKRETGRKSITVEGWDGKRKKYTPIEAALRHLVDQYQSPYFLLMTPEMANLFASFSSFEEWISKLKIVLTEEPTSLHPRMQKYNKRWVVAGVEPE